MQRLIFSSGDGGGFGAYHDLYAGGSTVSRLGPDFGASVVAYRFPRLLLFDRQVVGAAHQRDEERVRRDAFDHFTLQVLRGGRMLAGRPGEERLMEPGDVVVFDTTQPQRTVVERASYVALTLSRDVVEAALPDARRLHGAVLPRAAAGVLGDLVLSMAQNAPTLGAGVAARSGAVVADLLAGVAGDARPGTDGGGEPDALAVHRARAEAYIDHHLGDPALDADRVAAALGLSRSALYRAFALVDGVARQITVRRLERMRAALRQRRETRSIAALGFDLGFASESHCGRAFKAAFGVTPGQFRAEVHRTRLAREARRDTSGFDDWFCELY